MPGTHTVGRVRQDEWGPRLLACSLSAHSLWNQPHGAELQPEDAAVQSPTGARGLGYLLGAAHVVTDSLTSSSFHRCPPYKSENKPCAYAETLTSNQGLTLDSRNSGITFLPPATYEAPTKGIRGMCTERRPGRTLHVYNNLLEPRAHALSSAALLSAASLTPTGQHSLSS